MPRVPRGETPLSLTIGQGGRRGLIVFLGLAGLLCALCLAYLLVLPSDPEAHTLFRYSPERLLLITVPLFSMLITWGPLGKALLDTKWQARATEALYGDQRLLGRLVTVTVGAGTAGFMLILVAQPSWITGLNELRLQRLLPVLLLPIGMLLSLWLSRRIALEGIALTLSPPGLDVVCGTFLFLVALAARYPLTGYALPYTGIWDEVVTYAPALARVGGDELVVDKEISVWGRAGYGELLIELTTLAQVGGFLDGMRTQQVYSLEQFVSPALGVATIWEGVHPSGIPLKYPRVLFAVLNSIGPALVFLGLRRHLGMPRAPALVGGLLLAVGSREVVTLSSYILPDALAMTLFIGILICGMEILRDRNVSPRWFLLAGLLVGLGCGTVLRYVVFATVPVLAFFIGPDRTRPLAKAAWLGAGFAAGFVLSSPGYLTDLPHQLIRLSQITWELNLSIANRARSVVYYLREMFDTARGAGLGIPTLALALVGLTGLVSRRPRVGALLLAFIVLYLWWLSPIQSRATRHALPLFPIACMLAAVGLQTAADGLKSGWALFLGRFRRPRFRGKRLSPRVDPWLPRVVSAAFLIALAPRIRANADFVSYMARYETSQDKMAEFLADLIGPDDKVGVLDIVPFDLAALFHRGIPFERIAATDTFADLQGRGITLVVGSDLTSNEYASTGGTIWDTAFDGPDDRIAEFGTQELVFRGEPKPDVYLFAARIPPPQSP